MNNRPLNSLEVISNQFRIPKFPQKIEGCFLSLQNGILTAYGGTVNGLRNETCYQLENGFWEAHSTLKTSGHFTSTNMVKTSKAVYVFGADENCKKVQFLAHNSTNWKMCKEEIPGGFVHGCAVEIKSKGEIWLIGNVGETSNRILSFDLRKHTFKELPTKLTIGRSHHECLVTKIGTTEVILVTGGHSGPKNCIREKSVEIINIETGNVTLGSPLNFKRVGHGMGILYIKNQPKIAVFGGYTGLVHLRTIELFDQETLKWEKSEDIKMDEFRSSFGYLTV